MKDQRCRHPYKIKTQVGGRCSSATGRKKTKVEGHHWEVVHGEVGLNAEAISYPSQSLKLEK